MPLYLSIFSRVNPHPLCYAVGSVTRCVLYDTSYAVAQCRRNCCGYFKQLLWLFQTVVVISNNVETVVVISNNVRQGVRRPAAGSIPFLYADSMPYADPVQTLCGPYAPRWPYVDHVLTLC